MPLNIACRACRVPFRLHNITHFLWPWYTAAPPTPFTHVFTHTKCTNLSFIIITAHRRWTRMITKNEIDYCFQSKVIESNENSTTSLCINRAATAFGAGEKTNSNININARMTTSPLNIHNYAITTSPHQRT